MRRSLLLVLLSITTWARPVHAQGSSDVVAAGVGIGYAALSVGAMFRLLERADNAPLGHEVRATATISGTTRELRGRLTAIDADSVTFSANGTALRVARTDLRTMSVLEGTERKWAQGWAAGFVSGATVGVLGGFASGDDKGGGDLSFTASEKAVGLGIVGALAGSLLGSLVGSLIDGDHWRSVNRIPPGSAVFASPGRGGAFNIGASVRF